MTYRSTQDVSLRDETNDNFVEVTSDKQLRVVNTLADGFDESIKQTVQDSVTDVIQPTDNPALVRSVITNALGTANAEVYYASGRYRLATDSIITVDELLGFDNYADTFCFVRDGGNAGDTVRIQINTPTPVDVTTTITATEAGDIELVAKLICDDLAADPTFQEFFFCRTLRDKFYITARNPAEYGEVTGLNAYVVTTTGTVNLECPYPEIVRRKKNNLITPDPIDPRYGILGVRGEVSSVTKSDTPINIAVRKVLATSTQTAFIDRTVDTDQVWFISSVAVADDLDAEFDVWEGVQRDKVENFVGDGTLATWILDYGCLKSNLYHNVLVNGTDTYIEGTDYVIEDNPNDSTKSQLRWIRSANKPAIGDDVQITYDAVIRRVGLFISGSSSFEYTFEAPLKLRSSINAFVVVTVENRSGNAGVAKANLSGFYETELL